MSREPMLRTQLLTWLLVPLFILLAADTFISYWMALNFSQRAYDRTLVEIAREVSLHLKQDAGGLKVDMPEAARKVLLSDPSDRLFYEVIAPNGERIAGEPIPPPVRAPGAGAREVMYDAVLNGEPVRVVELRVQDEATATPAARVKVAETEVKRNQLLREILLSVIMPQVVIIVIAAALVSIGVVRGLSPLRRLQQAVASRSHYERGPVLAAVPREVRPLMDAFNELLARLDRLLTLQSRFVADAAHQLKTPVAGLQAQLELALREPDPERMRASVAKLYAGLERLSRLVSQLLSLARNEPEAVSTIKFVPIDLNELVLEAATGWVPEALKKQIDLGFEGADAAVMILGDAARLRELFDNLLDNAVRYTQEGGRVTVRVCRTEQATVAVSDDGPAIPAHERERVFQRFHRLLGSATDGSGLGLAIAEEIARIHGAEIALADDVDGIGNTFTVSFPLLGAV
jgi:two-component system sensor histidine kinase TctE